MKYYRLIIFTILTIFIISACATPYKSNGLKGGYSEEQLSERSYNVSFRGNGFTSSTRVQNLLMLRCAELTLQNDYKYFVIMDSDSDKKTSYSYNSFTENANAVDKHTKTAQIFMTNKNDLTKEEFKHAVNAKLYWENNK